MRGVILAALAVLTVAGCSDQPDETQVEVGSSSSATPSPKATTGTLLDLVPPKPERPADKRTTAGAMAFIDFAFKSVYYAYGTADPKPITDISDESTCRGCEQPISNAEVGNENGRLLLGTEPISVKDGELVTRDGEFVTLRVTVDFPQTVLVVKESAEAEGDRIPAAEVPVTVNLRWQDDRWVLLDYSNVEE